MVAHRVASIMAGAALCCLMISACGPAGLKKMDVKREVRIPDEFRETRPQKPPVVEPKTPDFVPAAEDTSPMKTRIVDIVARNTPLRDVLHVIAEATSLNLVIEQGVDPEIPVTMTLRNVTAHYALNTIFATVDYFYRVEDNLLTVRAIDTRAFEIGHPPMTQTYSVDVGGDILGGATGSGGSGGGSSGGSGGGSGQTGTMKGSVSQSIKGDESAFKFWDTLEKSVASILGIQEGQSAQAGSRQSFTINRLTGTVYVTATRKTLQRVDQYLSVVKKVINRQVVIEARVIEVQLSDGFQFGIDWTLVDRYVTQIDSTGATRTTGSFTYGTNLFNTVVSARGPVFTIIGAPSFGGSKADLRFVVRALQDQGEVRTLSNPRLSIMNGQTALLSVGRNETYISKVETTTTAGGGASTTTFTVDTNSVLSGILVGLLPHINELGEISLTITPIVSDLVKLTQQAIGTPTVVEISLPTVDLRELSTTVKVRDGDTVIIGGLISKKEKLQDNQVPFLGDIPILGTLFKSRDKSESRSELVVLLQPTLISR